MNEKYSDEMERAAQVEQFWALRLVYETAQNANRKAAWLAKMSASRIWAEELTRNAVRRASPNLRIVDPTEQLDWPEENHRKAL